MLVVSDTSPITSLLVIGKVDILRDIYQEIIIPPAVADELNAYHKQLPSFVSIARAKNVEKVEALTAQLDQGEAEAIVLAKETRADYLLIDETIGRSIACGENIPVVGLVGVLLVAKKRGIIASLGEMLDELQEKAGFYLGDDVRRLALVAAGE